MQLKDCVSYFSTETFIDVFNSAVSFVGKVNPFSEVASSGLAARRRILETPVTEAIPTDRVIEAPSGEKYIVASSNTDFWNSEVVRIKYPVLPVEEVGTVGSVGEVLGGAPYDTTTYAFPFFSRPEKDVEESSESLTGHELYFSKAKRFVRSDILTLSGQYYRLKTDTWIDAAGFSVAHAVRLDYPIASFDVKYDREEYDPVTDAYPEISLSNVRCFIEPLRQDYEFVTPSFIGIEVGDIAISILSGDVVLKVNDTIGLYRVLGVRNYGIWNTYQCRSAV